ncbi:uncharacterized protein LOC125947776 [Dermacentor silvarum]|uniref:uncharacterized protein LOC125947776 n=2 Tax=Dermacentor silvarum TaxID=543639 RepID=UPI002100A5F9|nr:uncharacterized protein LOC125947776 [Dermacentor silvarum]
MAALKVITRPLFMPSQATEPPREELVAKLKATIEEQAKEVKKLKRELIQAVDLNKRLTNALLEKIEIAHGKAEKEAEASARALHGNHAESMCADNLSVGHQLLLEDFGAHEKTNQATSTPSLNEGVFESADLGVTGGSHSPPPMRIEPAGVSTESAQAPMMMIEAGVEATSTAGVLVHSAQLAVAVHPGSPCTGGMLSTVDGQVQIGAGIVMPLNKWHYIMKSTSDAKCTLDVARHLWSATQAGERSLTGQACRTISDASGKLPATPAKVAAVKNCLEKYISEHPMGPPAPPPEHRLASVRKHLRSFFTEAGRQGKRVRKTGIAQT